MTPSDGRTALYRSRGIVHLERRAYDYINVPVSLCGTLWGDTPAKAQRIVTDRSLVNCRPCLRFADALERKAKTA